MIARKEIKHERSEYLISPDKLAIERSSRAKSAKRSAADCSEENQARTSEYLISPDKLAIERIDRSKNEDLFSTTW
ncbi:hypothetical protein [Anaerosporobacter sp.]